MKTNQNKAVIDIGSNSLRLLIATVKKHRVREIKRDIRTTRLAQGVKVTGQLDAKAVEETLNILKEWRSLTASYRAEIVRVVATSAVREANNREAFLKKINDEGFHCEIIEGEKEAELTYLGATYEWQGAPLVFDLGGGSLELIVHAPDFKKSLPVGAVKIFELFGDAQGSMPNPEKVQMYVNRILSDGLLASEISQLKTHLQNGENCIGVGGTATCLAQIYHQLSNYQKEVVHGTYLQIATLKTLVQKMNELTREKRCINLLVPRERSDIIVAGGYVIYYLLMYLNAEGFYASDDDMLLGMLLEYEAIK